MKFVTMTGMSRSGNHGVIRWIVAHYEEAGYSVHFYNNTVVAFLEHLHFVMPHTDPSVKKVLLVSLEDVPINQRFSRLSSVADHNILLLRDPANLFASRINGLAPNRGLALPDSACPAERDRALVATFEGMPSQVERYRNHYEEFSGATDFLRNKIAICYNSWVVDESYRRSVIEGGLGLAFTDSRYMARAGSSFGREPKSADEYFTRWRSVWNHPAYSRIRHDIGLMDVSRSMGVRPGEGL